MAQWQNSLGFPSFNCKFHIFNLEKGQKVTLEIQLKVLNAVPTCQQRLHVDKSTNYEFIFPLTTLPNLTKYLNFLTVKCCLNTHSWTTTFPVSTLVFISGRKSLWTFSQLQLTLVNTDAFDWAPKKGFTFSPHTHSQELQQVTLDCFHAKSISCLPHKMSTKLCFQKTKTMS